MNDLIQELAAALGPAATLSSEEVAARSSGIWGGSEGLIAAGLVRPANTTEVSKALTICHARKQPVVTHGGLTGLVQGAATTGGELILSTERMSGVEEVDPVGQTMTVWAGTPLETVQTEAERHGFSFPLDLGARGTATIGGNAATNAGGTRVIRYGMSRALILGLEAVLADGTIVSSMNQMLKNNAGYDIKQLFIGSEGTLGVITRLVLRLVPAARSQATGFVAMRSFKQVTEFLRFIDSELGGTLSAYEVLWQDYYRFITERLEASAPLAEDYAYFVLVEALGANEARDDQRFTEALASAMEKGLIDDAVIAKSEQERAKLWLIRDDVVRLLELEPMFIYDVSLPIRETESYVEAVRTDIGRVWTGAHFMAFGHLGDGNIHLAVCAGPTDGSAKEAVDRAVYEPLRQIGGSVSAEHGIGLEKKPYLSWCRTEAEIEVMRRVKSALDPLGIMNPGKIFD